MPHHRRRRRSRTHASRRSPRPRRRRSPVVDVAAPGRASGHYGRARVPRRRWRRRVPRTLSLQRSPRPRRRGSPRCGSLRRSRRPRPCIGSLCARAPSCGGRCLVVVGGDAHRVRAPRGARPGLVSVGALVVGSGLDGGGRCLVVVGGGACRVRAPRGARLGLVVDGALVVGPFVDLVRMLSWAPPASFPWLE